MSVDRLSRWSWLMQAGRCAFVGGMMFASTSLSSVVTAADAAAGADAKTEKEMKAYKEAIPGTEVAFEVLPIPGGAVS